MKRKKVKDEKDPKTRKIKRIREIVGVLTNDDIKNSKSEPKPRKGSEKSKTNEK
jgi:hypothetical protein